MTKTKELKKIDLSKSDALIPSQLLAPAAKLEWISLAGINIPVLTPFLLKNKKKLAFFSLADCKIQAVLDSTFSEAKKMEFLILRNNQLKHITAGQLKGLENLVYLGIFYLKKIELKVTPL